ncbi:hypothetical protein PPL_08203 [Heterostelium album PN500]|uniref:Uncharacterized protein n=1 Tax=Heterostelium pallidum (strain ATCC 26659 / Pp 5 / PN500) TaxID=670386 RepID=D3BIW8_HETP5|nr:hypothetical protein PPL_08203 [Heterostelium album PN500]EFA78742.1 hypothetical protein PPL_08203 [Heterostelium album PN500]|eukprot:XP_020430866.1 hypothetical protein PPL_08203 [Heterostelium album PN500]
MNYKSLLSIVLLIGCFLIDNSYSQYTNDTCTRYTSSSGVVTVNADSTQYCWKIMPDIGVGYYPTEIYVTFQQVSGLIAENNTMFVIAGELMTDEELAHYITDSSTPQPMLTSKAGQVLIYVEYEAPVNFTFEYSISSEKSLKASILMLVSVVFAFAIPTFFVSCITCCTGKKDKKKLKSRQTCTFWFSAILGLVILAIVLSRKVIH